MKWEDRSEQNTGSSCCGFCVQQLLSLGGSVFLVSRHSLLDVARFRDYDIETLILHFALLGD